jgi:general secretion pathway protein K
MTVNNKGVAIIAVLWVCALIMWISLEVSADNRLRGLEDAQAWRKSQALYLAIGGANEALARLGTSATLDMGSKSQGEWQPDGLPQVVEYKTGRAIVVIEDETKKVNINLVDREQMRDVLETAGFEEGNSDVLADVIGDFIDADDLPRLQGAERDQYKDMGLPAYLPFNERLSSIDQLLLMPGVNLEAFYGYHDIAEDSEGDASDALSDAMLPGKDSLFELFTVYGKNTLLQDADQDGIFEDDQEKGTSSQEKSTGSSSKQGELDDFGANDTVTWVSGGTYRILSCGRAATGPPSVVMCLIVRYSPGSRNGYEVLYRKIL